MKKLVDLFFASKKAWFLLLLIGMTFYRFPSLLYEPRFYAEEGFNFFTYAYKSSWFDSLTAIHIGYYSLFLNVAGTLSAKTVPLAYAPYVTTYLSFLLQFVPIVLVLWGRSVFFDTDIKRGMVCFFILLTLPGELWLNTTCSQFILCLVTFLILVQKEETLRGGLKWMSRISLCVAGLSGLISCFFTPLFFIKYLKTKHRETRRHLVILLSLSVVQFSISMIFILAGYTLGRFHCAHALGTALNFVYQNILSPVFGQGMLEQYHKYLNSNIQRNWDWTHPVFVTQTILFLIFIVCLVWLLASAWKRRELRVGVVSYLLIAVMTTLLSMGMLGGERYSYVPRVILLMVLLSQVRFDLPGRLNRLKSVLSLLILVTFLYFSMAEFRYRMRNSADESLPKWREEIALWEQNHNHLIRIWPQIQDQRWMFEMPLKYGEAKKSPSGPADPEAPK
ncbi:MAG: hypothetical protein KJ645_07095 [Planctomycetes bacterium]|nr:hypothetical protein [Planctomycetota bacterium]